MEEIVADLQFPEGPIAMPDGSIILVEIARGTLSRVWNGKTEVIADLGGGPNGAAIGPDGACYVCNNGGFKWATRNGLMTPYGRPDDYTSGSIQRVDLSTGKFETIYTSCNGHQLNGPNDIVFDETGNFWFTDLGKHYNRVRDISSLFYAKPDGSSVEEVIHPLTESNGVGLSPDGKTVYVAETGPGRLWAWDLSADGVIDPAPSPNKGRLVAGLPGLQMFDSLAVDAEGHICVATLLNGGITSISPDGAEIEHFPTGDPITTNICFGGADLQDAYLTLSGTGKLVRTRWKRPGTPLWFLNR